MRDIFLVTSAIYSKIGKSGKLSPQERIVQTIETAKSIRVHLPDAKIYLLEGGSETLSLSLRENFLQVYNDIIDYSFHPFISFAHQKIDLDKQEITVIKGPCESFMLRETCKLLNVDSTDRIYKISGRYLLNENFNANVHREAKGKYLMLQRKKCLEYYSEPSKTTYSPYQYSTRLYSFCGSIIDKAIKNYNTINENLLSLYSQSQYIDLEHMTYLTYQQEIISEIPAIGLSGQFAENPQWKIEE